MHPYAMLNLGWPTTGVDIFPPIHSLIQTYHP
jgi:hypothetical protein